MGRPSHARRSDGGVNTARYAQRGSAISVASRPHERGNSARSWWKAIASEVAHTGPAKGVMRGCTSGFRPSRVVMVE